MHPALGWEESEAGSRDKLLREASILPLLWRGKKNEQTDDHFLAERVYNPLQKDVFLSERENHQKISHWQPLCVHESTSEEGRQPPLGIPDQAGGLVTVDACPPTPPPTSP